MHKKQDSFCYIQSQVLFQFFKMALQQQVQFVPFCSVLTTSSSLYPSLARPTKRRTRSSKAGGSVANALSTPLSLFPLIFCSTQQLFPHPSTRTLGLLPESTHLRRTLHRDCDSHHCRQSASRVKSVRQKRIISGRGLGTTRVISSDSRLG